MDFDFKKMARELDNMADIWRCYEIHAETKHNKKLILAAIMQVEAASTNLRMIKKGSEPSWRFTKSLK